MTSTPTYSPQFDARSRLLVLAPHPDDETLATGELMLAARAAGAEVRVVFATDGDNNPWPQRWIEKRWRIDAGARARWGMRRRAEATRALGELGVDAGALRFLGWPDQGLTDRLMADGEAESVLTEEIAAFAPSHLAFPALADRHPDHGALGMLARLAVARAGCSAVQLEYIVHGPGEGLVALAADADRKRAKVRALSEHASQLVLSGERLHAIAERAESFLVRSPRSPRPALPIAGGRLELQLPLAAERWLRGHQLLALVQEGGAVLRWRLPVPRRYRLHTESRALGDGREAAIRIDRRQAQVHLCIDGLPRATTEAYFKLERNWPRLVVFDALGWQDARQLPSGDPLDRRASLAAGHPAAREADPLRADG